VFILVSAHCSIICDNFTLFCRQLRSLKSSRNGEYMTSQMFLRELDLLRKGPRTVSNGCWFSLLLFCLQSYEQTKKCHSISVHLSIHLSEASIVLIWTLDEPIDSYQCRMVAYSLLFWSIFTHKRQKFYKVTSCGGIRYMEKAIPWRILWVATRQRHDVSDLFVSACMRTYVFECT